MNPFGYGGGGLGPWFSTLAAFTSPLSGQLGGGSLYPGAGSLGLRKWFSETARSVATTIATWLERSEQRSELATLGDHLLNDIGLTRREALDEAQKPFWRP